MKQFLLTCLIWISAFTLLFSQDYNVLSFGAVPDSKTLNTRSIQAAIDQAHSNGGGRVVVPNGTFLSGSLVLKSNVELHLKKNAVLLGSPDPNDYQILNRWKGLVMADHAENIALTGLGTLDGQGAKLGLHLDSLFYAGQIDSSKYQFAEKRVLAPLRPQVLEFVRCKHIRVNGITMQNAASWVQTYELCEELVIDKIKVLSDAYWNNDGIDIVDCKNVRLTNSYFNSSDDGICLKSYNKGGTLICDSIFISNCTVRSSASAVKFGTASYAGFRDVHIENIKVYDTFRSAIALEIVDGGLMENVLVENIRARNTGNAIFIRLGERYKKLPVGTLKNVTIRNVKVQVPFGPPDTKYEIRGPALPFFHNTMPASITGIPGHPVENVTLENIQITYPGRGNKAYANMPLHRINDVPEQEHLYPEFSMFGELPAWGFYVRHVEGLTMKNVRVRIRKPDYRPAFVFDDVKGLKTEDIEVVGDDKPGPLFYQNVEHVKD